MTLLLSVVLALLLDRVFGEPKKLHPLVMFGNLAARIEKRYNTLDSRRYQGVFAVLIAVVPISFLCWFMDSWSRNYESIYWVFSGFMLYLTIGWQSLLQHAVAVIKPLEEGQLCQARQAVSMLVSRETSNLDQTQIANAATESILENGADAIFSALFWFFVAGVPGVIAYRLTNTLDAMWGYKNERFIKFGWAAARVDDILNFIPARLTATSYALVGNTTVALRCWWQQAGAWKSPNAGPVMAAGAGALNVSLGGAAYYHGRLENRPLLGPQVEPNGETTNPSAATIAQACSLLNRAIALWITALIIWVFLA